MRQTDVHVVLRQPGTLTEASFCKIVYLLQDRKGPDHADGCLKQWFQTEGLDRVVTAS